MPGPGHCILLTILSRDSTNPVWRKALYLTVTGALTVGVVPRLSTLLATHVNVDSSWDVRHGIIADRAMTDIDIVTNLFRESLGVDTPFLSHVALPVTVALFAALFAADAAGALWPASWNTSQSRCYDQMFSEPRRHGRLVAHVGNTLSNAVYFLASLLVLRSSLSSTSAFCSFADALFGAMLLLLAIMSVLWHACNPPKVHYLDLWSMDACIVFLIVRTVATGIVGSGIAAPFTVSIITFLVYSLLIFRIALKRCGGVSLSYIFGGFGSGPLDAQCTFSARGRLAGGNPNTMNTADICAYWALPAIYMIVPTLMQVMAIGSTGSVVAGTICSSTLVVGWTVRMFERFTLDGWGRHVMRTDPRSSLELIDTKGEADGKTPLPVTDANGLSFAHLAWAAAVSPTAVLHWTTGLTLLFGYAWVRTLDQAVLPVSDDMYK